MDNVMQTEVKSNLTSEEIKAIAYTVNCLDKQLKIIVKLFNDLAEKIINSKDL